MLDKKDYDLFKKTLKAKDRWGNNVFHDIFMLDKKKRNQFLEIIYNRKYFVKAIINPHLKDGCCGRKYKVHNNEFDAILARSEEDL